jgi:hypothetical protein
MTTSVESDPLSPAGAFVDVPVGLDGENGVTVYPLSLAAEDVVPIVLAGIGYKYLTDRVEATMPEVAPAMRAAALLLVVGSAAAGPTRKVLVNRSGGASTFPALQTPFFSALAPGFAVLTWGTVAALTGRKPSFLPYAGALAVGVTGAVATRKRVVLLGSGGLWAVAAGAGAAVLAKRQGDLPTTGLYAAYAAGTLALPAIGGKDDVSSLKNQWLAQGINTASQAAFAAASFRLLSAFRRQGKLSSGENAT